MQLGLWGISKHLQYFREEDDDLIVPVGYWHILKKFLPHHSIIDNRFENPIPVDITFTGKTREYQDIAVSAMNSVTNGVLVAKGGAGKTVMMIKMICDQKKTALILTHTKELANQFVDRLTQFTNLKVEDIGFVGAGRFELKPITVALMQSIVKIEDFTELNKLFSVVFTDECQIVPCDTMYDNLSRLTAKYKYGASGTPSRADGLTKVIFWLTGPIQHTIPDEALEGSTLTVKLRVVPTTYFFPLFSSSEYTTMISDLSVDEERNNLILNTVAEYPTQQLALLGQRIDQVKWFQERIPGSVTLHSGMKNAARRRVMEGLTTGEYRVVLTTYALFKLGIDLSDLEVMFFCAPIRNENMIIQSAWRLARMPKLKLTKDPIVVDFADLRVDLLKHQFYQRQRILKKAFKL